MQTSNGKGSREGNGKGINNLPRIQRQMSKVKEKAV